LKSQKFVVFQDNWTIFGTCMSVWTENMTAKFYQQEATLSQRWPRDAPNIWDPWKL